MRSLLLCLVVLAAGCQTDGDGLSPAASPATENPMGAAPTAAASYDLVDTPDELVEAIREVDADLVLVNYWATWCAPCIAEFPDLMRYDADNAGEGIEVRFVSVNLPSEGEAVQAFLDKQGVSEPSFLYAGPGDIIGHFDPAVAGIVPVTMVFDADGDFIKSHMGVLDYDAIDQLVAEARAT